MSQQKKAEKIEVHGGKRSVHAARSTPHVRWMRPPSTLRDLTGAREGLGSRHPTRVAKTKRLFRGPFFSGGRELIR